MFLTCRWRNISAIYRFLVLRSVIFRFPIAGPSLPGLAWPPACLSAGRPAHLSSQPADCQHSQAALNHKNTEISTIQNSLLCRTAAVCLPHTTTKKILWKPCMWFFFWNDMEIIWWNDNKKRWLFVKWKHEHCKLCICEEFNGAKFKSPIKPYYISCKKQAQFKEKNLQNVEYWRPILIVKKLLCNDFAVSMTHKKSSNWISFFLPDQFFPMPRSIWHFWTVIGGILTKKNRRDFKKEDNFCQFTNFSLSLFKPTLLWVYQNFLWLW